MKTVTNRSHAKSMTINIGGKEHSYKKYSWGLHHPTFGPLKDEKFNSKTEMKSAMEKHPRYNPKLQNEEAQLDEISYRDSGARNMLRASMKADRIAAADRAKRAKQEKLNNPPAVKEEVAVNAAGAGNVAGLGVGPQGEPGVKKKKKNVMSFNRFMKK
jgi:hypothetical protein